jgi:hypothetical protein
LPLFISLGVDEAKQPSTLALPVHRRESKKSQHQNEELEEVA